MISSFTPRGGHDAGDTFSAPAQARALQDLLIRWAQGAGVLPPPLVDPDDEAAPPNVPISSSSESELDLFGLEDFEA